jgi:hypothetical protein
MQVDSYNKHRDYYPGKPYPNRTLNSGELCLFLEQRSGSLPEHHRFGSPTDPAEAQLVV